MPRNTVNADVTQTKQKTLPWLIFRKHKISCAKTNLHYLHTHTAAMLRILRNTARMDKLCFPELIGHIRNLLGIMRVVISLFELRLTFTGQTAWVTGPRNRLTMGARKSLLADQRKPPMHGRLEHNVVPLEMKGVLIPLIDSGRTPRRGQPGPSTNSKATTLESFSSDWKLI